MIPIARLLKDIRRGARQARKQGWNRPLLVRNVPRLLGKLSAGEKRRKASQKRLGVCVPRFCLFSVTWRCNLKCKGCYARNYAQRGDMSLDQIGRVVDEACRLGSYLFVIVGGEPLLVDGLIELLSARDDALFFLFTNATLLGPPQAEFLGRCRNVLPVISVEGDQLLTDARRGPGVGEKVGEAMRLLRESNAALGFSSMVTHRNVETVTSRAWFDDLFEAGARFGFLIDYVPLPHGLEPSLILTDADRRRKDRRVAQRYREARPLVLNFPPDEYTTGCCQSAGRGFIHINADGYVEPCPFSHYASHNVLEAPLEEIYASPFMRMLRDAFTDAPNPGGHCMLFKHDEQVRRIAAHCGAFSTERQGGARETGSVETAWAPEATPHPQPGAGEEKEDAAGFGDIPVP